MKPFGVGRVKDSPIHIYYEHLKSTRQDDSEDYDHELAYMCLKKNPLYMSEWYGFPRSKHNSEFQLRLDMFKMFYREEILVQEEVERPEGKLMGKLH